MDDVTVFSKQHLGISLSKKQQDQLLVFEQELISWNKKVNLTAITSPEDIRVKHFLDSLSCTLAWKNEKPPKKLIDIGTGAGFPGIVLKIVYPDMHCTLVESVGKKMDFCKHIIHVLNLSDVDFRNQRAEVLGQQKEYREQYDVAVARAVASLPILSRYLLPFVKIGGFMIALKGDHVNEELEQSKHVFFDLGGTLKEIIPFTFSTQKQARNIIVVEKTKKTPLK